MMNRQSQIHFVKHKEIRKANISKYIKREDMNHLKRLWFGIYEADSDRFS